METVDLPSTNKSDTLEVLCTFAVPFYSGMAYLKETVASVLSQSTDRWKLLVVDDCGPDTDAAEAFIHGLNDSRIKFYRNPKNLGLAGNWNRCLDLADTDLVNVLHSDDRLLPHYAVAMSAAARARSDCVLFFCNARIIGEDSRPVFSFADAYKKLLVPIRTKALILEGEDGLTSLMRGNYIMCPTVLYRKSLLENQRFDSNWQMVLDLEFYARLLQRGMSLAGISEVHYEYRRHSTNQTVKLTANLRRFEEECRILDVIAQQSLHLGWKKAAAVASKKTIVILNLGYLIVTDLVRLRFKPCSLKINFLMSLVLRRLKGTTYG